MATVGLPATSVDTIAALHAARSITLVFLEFTIIDMTIAPGLYALAFSFAFVCHHAHVFATARPSDDRSAHIISNPF